MSYNYDTSRNSPNYTPAPQVAGNWGIGPRTIEGITIHWWGSPAANPVFANIRDYLCRGNGNTSAHFVATGTGRQVACIVSPNDAAWHAGSGWGNVHTIGIEMDPRCRDEDYDVVAELIADIRSAYGDVPLRWHKEFSSTACPGNVDVVRLDNLSYTKYSAAQWGQGGNKVATPAPAPAPVVVAPVATVLYKLVVDGKQVAAYGLETNAFQGYIQYGKKGTITLNGKDITSLLVTKYQTPSPTTIDPVTANPLPDTGKDITDKADYTEFLAELKKNNSLIQWLIDFLTKIFK